MTFIIKPTTVVFADPVDGWGADVLPDPIVSSKPRCFLDLEFSPASKEYLNHPDAIAYLPEFGGVLASADEVLWYRFGANGNDRANDYHGSRTATFRFVKDGRVLVAVDDSPNLEENILLQTERVNEGYERHNAGKEWLVSLHDPVVAGAIARATVAGRIYQAFDVDLRELVLDGTYQQDAVVRALIPQTAQKNEQYLREAGFTRGCVWDLTAKQCSESGVTEETALIRRVGVGGGSDYDGRNDLYAVGRLDYGGLARRVREKSSTGSGGSLR